MSAVIGNVNWGSIGLYRPLQGLHGFWVFRVYLKAFWGCGAPGCSLTPPPPPRVPLDGPCIVQVLGLEGSLKDNDSFSAP